MELPQLQLVDLVEELRVEHRQLRLQVPVLLLEAGNLRCALRGRGLGASELLPEGRSVVLAAGGGGEPLLGGVCSADGCRELCFCGGERTERRQRAYEQEVGEIQQTLGSFPSLVGDLSAQGPSRACALSALSSAAAAAAPPPPPPAPPALPWLRALDCPPPPPPAAAAAAAERSRLFSSSNACARCAESRALASSGRSRASSASSSPTRFLRSFAALRASRYLALLPEAALRPTFSSCGIQMGRGAIHESDSSYIRISYHDMAFHIASYRITHGRMNMHA